MKIPLSKADITDREIEYVTQVLRSPMLSGGPKVLEFEENVANYVGSKYAIAVNSGTSGLHLCMKSLGIGYNDEVITTPFSFIASANCILFERAKPVFVDIAPGTFNIDPAKIEEKITDKTRAILPVHILGQPCGIDQIMNISERYDLAVIEDACEAIGAEYQGKKVGTFGRCGVFGFFPNKQITTGEGGIIVTHHEEIASFCRILRNQGKGSTNQWLPYSRLGYNYRLSDINCSLGIAQLERIEEILGKRAKVAEIYNRRLKDVDGIKTLYISPEVKMSWFIYVIKLDDKFTKEDRDRIMHSLKQKRIDCKNYFPPIHLQKFYVDMFGYKRGDFPICERVSERTMALPFFNDLTEEMVGYICTVLESVL